MKKQMFDLVMTKLEETLKIESFGDPDQKFSQETILRLVDLSIKTVMAEMLLNGTYYASGGR